MGVGLSVVRSLVEMHGGTVQVTSDGKDSGSEFCVRLPRVVEAIGEPVTRQPVPWPTGKRVVVVEDNHDGREMLQLLLERSGYEVFTAADGKSGLALIDRLTPDLAIVDIGLPIMDGFELARRVRERPQHEALYLVALTGYGQASDHTAALAAGFDEHLVKPLDPDELMRWIKAEA
jgi:two-component system CheB/CheR fusion protein